MHFFYLFIFPTARLGYAFQVGSDIHDTNVGLHLTVTENPSNEEFCFLKLSELKQLKSFCQNQAKSKSENARGSQSNAINVRLAAESIEFNQI